MNEFVNISYGSNLHPIRLTKRCRSAEMNGTAQLCGWKLAFHKRSNDGSGKCNAMKTNNPEDHIWVAVFRISAEDKPILDRAEGLGYGYNEERMTVAVSGQDYVGSMYLADQAVIDDSLRPYDWYKSMVVLGAQFHDFPAAYLKALQEIEGVPDPDPKRQEEQLRIVDEIEAANQRLQLDCPQRERASGNR